jgi:hypothetical protein
MLIHYLKMNYLTILCHTDSRFDERAIVQYMCMYNVHVTAMRLYAWFMVSIFIISRDATPVFPLHYVLGKNPKNVINKFDVLGWKTSHLPPPTPALQ